jgi:anti-anti-sigma regulatory factor
MFGLSQKRDGLNNTPHSGGFDVVIGNPPYGGKYSESDKKYFLKNYESTKTIKNVQKGSLDTYVLFLEKAHSLVAKNGIVIMIVNMSVVSSDSTSALHNILFKTCGLIQISNYAKRPAQIFSAATVNVSIIKFIKNDKECKKLLTTKMVRWDGVVKLNELINNLEFVDSYEYKLFGRLPKIGKNIELSILEKFFSKNNIAISELRQEIGEPIFYRVAGGRYYNIITNYSTGSTQEKPIYFDKKIANCVGAILSSSLFWWYLQVYYDVLHIKSYEIENFTIPTTKLTDVVIKKLEKLYSDYLIDIEKNANIRTTTEKSSYNVAEFKEYKIGKSKHIIDKIEDLICPLYGLTKEETEFIKNYEIEFRIANGE